MADCKAEENCIEGRRGSAGHLVANADRVDRNADADDMEIRRCVWLVWLETES